MGRTPTPLETEFRRHVFHLRPKALAISQDYVIRDEEGLLLMTAERPLQAAASAGALLLVIGGVIGAMLLGTLISVSMWEKGGSRATLGVVLGLLVGGGIAGTAVFVALNLGPRRSLSVFRERPAKSKVLGIEQVGRGRVPAIRFTVSDAGGVPIGAIQRNLLASPFAAKWECVPAGSSGRFYARARGGVDALVLSLLRRGRRSRPMFRFYLGEGGSAELVGEFRRRSGLLNMDLLTMTESPDVLDLSDDPEFEVDRRLALALAMIVDSPEEG